MATTVQHVDAGFRTDLETHFDVLQTQRTAALAQFRDVQLAARVLMLAEARRLAADAGDPRPAQFAAAGGVIANRVAALDIESQISELRVAPPTRAAATAAAAAGNDAG